MKVNRDKEEYKRDYSFMYQAIRSQIEKRGLANTYNMISKIEERLIVELKDKKHTHIYS